MNDKFIKELMARIFVGLENIVYQLLNISGADINAKDMNGDSSFILAIRNGKLNDMFEWFLTLNSEISNIQAENENR